MQTGVCIAGAAIYVKLAKNHAIYVADALLVQIAIYLAKNSLKKNAKSFLSHHTFAMLATSTIVLKTGYMMQEWRKKNTKYVEENLAREYLFQTVNLIIWKRI